MGFKRLIANYGAASFTINNGGSDFPINVTVKFDADSENPLIGPYSQFNVVSPYLFKISPKYGVSFADISLSALDELSSLNVSLAQNFSTGLVINGITYSVVNANIIIGGFQQANIGFETFIKGNYIFPYNFVRNVEAIPGTISNSIFNVSSGNGSVYTENNRFYQLSGHFNLSSLTNINLEISPATYGTQLDVKYSIQASFSQIYDGNNAVFRVSQYKWPNEVRVVTGLIEGSFIGGSVSLFLEGFRDRESI